MKQVQISEDLFLSLIKYHHQKKKRKKQDKNI